MAWTAPMTAIAGGVFTAAQWNVHGRDDLNMLAPAIATAGGGWIVSTGPDTIAQRIPVSDQVAAAGSTDSTSYTDLSSAGASVTVTHGVRALVSIGAQVSNTVAGLGARVSVDVSGANSQEAADFNCFYAESGNASDAFKGAWTTIFNPLTAGVSTFTLKYRAAGSGGVATFSSRFITVISF
jgi:hypothetical protein